MRYIKAAEEAPCKVACPIEIDVPAFLRSISAGRIAEARAVLLEKTPFPAVLGRVCFHSCEVKCNLHGNGGSCQIRMLHRFVTEQGAGENIQEVPVAKPSGRRVAIVGSGPAGLTAAFYLLKEGHAVTVFEALPEAGGMMRFGIPAYRLLRDVLAEEIALIFKAGGELKTGVRVLSLDELFDQGYDAVFLAVGAHQGVRMGIAGEDGEGVKECISFLREVNSGQEVGVGNHVVVIGGGNAAIDASRTAVRLGAKEITVAYRRSRAEMPAYRPELDQALAEGVKFSFLVSPLRIERNNGKVEVWFVRNRLSQPDASGRKRPEPLPGTEFRMDVDTLIVAVGELPQIPEQFDLVTDPGGLLKVDPESLATIRQGVFAGGDAVTGPASVVHAMAAGRKAAQSINKYLGKNGLREEEDAPSEQVFNLLAQGLPVGPRLNTPTLPVGERLKDFREVELSVDPEAAMEEAKRCLNCDLPISVDTSKCIGCLICQLRCSLKLAGVLNPLLAALRLERGEKGTFAVEFTDKCTNCGFCVRYCPYGGLQRGRE